MQTSIASTDVVTIPEWKFHIPHAGGGDPTWTPSSLEGLRDIIKVQNDNREPEDVYGALDLAHLEWTSPTIALAHLKRQEDGSKVRASEPVLLTRWALQQMSKDVLPSRGLDTLMSLRHKSPTGAKVATMAWSTLAEGMDRPRLFRTILDPGTGHRVIRGVVSPNFTDFDDEMLVDTMLTELGNLPVLDARRWQKGFRVRVRLDGNFEAPTLREQVKVIEGWNGEVASRSIGVQGGIWCWWCANGQVSYVPQRTRRFRHLGNMETLKVNMHGAVEEEVARSEGLAEAYAKARTVAVDDLFALMEEELRSYQTVQLSTEQVTRATNLLTSNLIPTPDFSLARGVDAVTLAAQQETDPVQQERMEMAASRLMHRGITRFA